MPSDVLILVTTGTSRSIANRFLTLACPVLTAIALTRPNFARPDSQAECRRFDSDHPLQTLTPPLVHRWRPEYPTKIRFAVPANEPDIDALADADSRA